MNLVTPRLLLRDFVADDWRAVMDYHNEPNYLKFNPWESNTQQQVQELIAMLLRQQKVKFRMKFDLGIVLPSTGQLIGMCGIRINDQERREANIGYELDYRYWGQGYATEAALEMVHFGFETLGMRCIWAECFTDNIASNRVLEKVGMQRQDDFRGREFFKNRWWAISHYAILDQEWQKRF